MIRVGRYVQDRREARRYFEAVRSYNAYQTEINFRRRLILNDWREIKKSQLSHESGFDSSLDNTVAELDARIDGIVKAAITIEQLDRLKSRYHELTASLRSISDRLVASKAEALSELEQLKKTRVIYRSWEQRDRLIDGIVNELRDAASVAEIEDLVTRARTEITVLAMNYRRFEQSRISRELRADVNEKGNSRRILDDFMSLAQSGEAIDASAQEAIAEKMENDFELKRFVNLELQYLRRLDLLKRASRRSKLDAGGVASAGMPKGDEDASRQARIEDLRKVIALRFAIDRAALLRTLEVGGEDAVAKIRLVRKSLLVLGQAEVFQGLAARGWIRPLHLGEREQIVWDAFANEELAVVLYLAAVSLKESLEPPQMQGPQPSPKSPVSRNRAEIYIDDWEAYMEWRTNWDEFVRELHEMRATRIPDFKQKLIGLRETHLRRQRARQAYIAYLAVCRPEFLARPQSAEPLRQVLLAARDKVYAGLSGEQAGEAVNWKKKFDVAVERIGQEAPPFLRGWFPFFYLLFPEWLDGKNRALENWLNDVVNFSLPPLQPSDVHRPFGTQLPGWIASAEAKVQKNTMTTVSGLTRHLPMSLPFITEPTLVSTRPSERQDPSQESSVNVPLAEQEGEAGARPVLEFSLPSAPDDWSFDSILPPRLGILPIDQDVAELMRATRIKLPSHYGWNLGRPVSPDEQTPGGGSVAWKDDDEEYQRGLDHHLREMAAGFIDRGTFNPPPIPGQMENIPPFGEGSDGLDIRIDGGASSHGHGPGGHGGFGSGLE